MPDITPTDPGEFWQPITIQQPSTATDSYGEATPTWTTFAKAWAKIEQLSGGERFYASEVTARVVHRINMRYLPGLTEQMQILWGAKTLKIDNVNDLDGRHIEHVLICVELRPQS